MTNWRNRPSYKQEAGKARLFNQQIGQLNAQLRDEDYTRQAATANLSQLVAQADNRLTANAAVAHALSAQNIVAPETKKEAEVASPYEVFRFVVGTRGLETSIAEYMAEEEFWECSDLPPNISWEHIAVRTPEDAQAWIAAKNAYLCAAWTPNQDEEERAANKIIMHEALAEMGGLEIIDG
jgi:hypothetical protein